MSPHAKQVLALALASSESMPLSDRISVLHGIADLTPRNSQEHKQAKHTAALLEEAARQQTTFLQALRA